MCSPWGAVMVRTFGGWLEILAQADALVPARIVLARWRSSEEAEATEAPSDTVGPLFDLTWQVRLWVVPEETRIRLPELCEALGRSPSWVYHHTGPASHDRIPHSKMGGELVFRAGQVRGWLREAEDVVVPGSINSRGIASEIYWGVPSSLTRSRLIERASAVILADSSQRSAATVFLPPWSDRRLRRATAFVHW